MFLAGHYGHAMALQALQDAASNVSDKAIRTSSFETSTLKLQDRQVLLPAEVTG